jgi:hypothetical protein
MSQMLHDKTIEILRKAFLHDIATQSQIRSSENETQKAKSLIKEFGALAIITYLREMVNHPGLAEPFLRRILPKDAIQEIANNVKAITDDYPSYPQMQFLKMRNQLYSLQDQRKKMYLEKKTTDGTAAQTLAWGDMDDNIEDCDLGPYKDEPENFGTVHGKLLIKSYMCNFSFKSSRYIIRLRFYDRKATSATLGMCLL